MNKRNALKVASGLGLAVAAGLAGATSIVDYTTIMSGVTTELTAGLTAAAVGLGTIWAAKIGVRFVRSLLH